MMLISVDPGEQTGLVFCEDLQYFEAHTLFYSEALFFVKGFLPRIDYALVESAPSVFPLAAQLARVQGFRMLFEEAKIPIEWIRPADWKPLAKPQAWDNTRLKTHHEVDAYGLLMYHMWRQGLTRGPLYDEVL